MDMELLKSILIKWLWKKKTNKYYNKVDEKRKQRFI
jgi:hypothetical protein